MTAIENRYRNNGKKIVIFGAGKIGRSFIGQLFSISGYEVVFVDINRKLTDELNQKRQYKVVIKSDDVDEVIIIKNIRAVWLTDSDQVISELADSTIAALSVGQQGLPDALPILVKSLIKRREQFDDWPLDFIIAENMRNSDQYLFNELHKYLPEDYPQNKLVGLVETSIGKMVPIMSLRDFEEDHLQVFAEPYNTLIVAQKGFRNPFPEVHNLEPKANIKAWVDRKAFIHNLGHAAAAYYGHYLHADAVYMYEVFEDTEVLRFTKDVMLQSADILRTVYPDDFIAADLENHIEDLIHRFRNKALQDTIFRVGQDLIRKLSADDRFMGSMHLAIKYRKPYDLILKAMSYGLCFNAKDEKGNLSPSDNNFLDAISKDFESALINELLLDPITDNSIIETLKGKYTILRHNP